MKRIAKTADEQDVVTGWRHLLCRYRRAGATDRIKRGLRRRERRDGKIELRRDPERI